MQTNMAINADYDGELGTNEVDGYGGELEFDAMSNGNSSNYSPRQSCKIGLKICALLWNFNRPTKNNDFSQSQVGIPNFRILFYNFTPRMIDGVETTELQRLIPNSPNAQENNYV